MYQNVVMPTEPTLDQSSHFMEPLITQVKILYEKGVRYSWTDKHRKDRQTRPAIIVFVNDLPGGKKVAQIAGHTSKLNLCSLCTLQKDHTNQVDPTLWVPHNVAAVQSAAYSWNKATSKAEQGGIFAKFSLVVRIVETLVL